MGGIIPREESSYDRFSQETIVEAVWVCHRCGSRFGSGVVSRTKDNEKK
jgi:PHP family Zn ribbon phosphoesterase